MIELSKSYIPLLDEVYQNASLTQDLNSDNLLTKAGDSPNEIKIPKLSMSGLGNYSRNSGYTKGKVNLKYETVKFNYDRGAKFEVDYLDNEETAEVAFGMLGAEFERTMVAPEGDAFTFAVLAGKEGISKIQADLNDGIEIRDALRKGTTVMDNDKVPRNQRILYIKTGYKGLVDDLDTTKSKEIFNRFDKIVEVPESEFYTAIALNDIEDEENGLNGGYDKLAPEFKKSEDTSVEEGKTYYTVDGKGIYSKVLKPTGNPVTNSYYEISKEGGKNINFLIVHKPAVIKYDKRKANNIITPEENQTSDAYMQKYRKYGLVDVYENKLAGIYLHYATK